MSMAKAVFIPPAELVVFLRLSTQQEKVPNAPAFGTFGGDEGDRTPYLLNAIQALSPYKRVAPPLNEVGEGFWCVGDRAF